jgi:hypothetical protein
MREVRRTVRLISEVPTSELLDVARALESLGDGAARLGYIGRAGALAKDIRMLRALAHLREQLEAIESSGEPAT